MNYYYYYYMHLHVHVKLLLLEIVRQQIYLNLNFTLCLNNSLIPNSPDRSSSCAGTVPSALTIICTTRNFIVFSSSRFLLSSLSVFSNSGISTTLQMFCLRRSHIYGSRSRKYRISFSALTLALG